MNKKMALLLCIVVMAWMSGFYQAALSADKMETFSERRAELKVVGELRESVGDHYSIPVGNEIVVISKEGSIQSFSLVSKSVVKKDLSLGSGVDVQAVIKLPDGRILITGLISQPDKQLKAFSKIFASNTNTLKNTAPMHVPRQEYTATLLESGKVLIVGGEDLDLSTKQSGYLDSLELFDPKTNLYKVIDVKLRVPRLLHIANRLTNGSIFIAGGQTTTGNSNDIEIFSPSSNTIEQAGQTPLWLLSLMASYSLQGNRVLVIPKLEESQIYTAKEKEFITINGPICGNGYGSVPEYRIEKIDSDLLLVIGVGIDPPLIHNCENINLFSQKANEYIPIRLKNTLSMYHSSIAHAGDEILIVQGKKVYKLLLKGSANAR